MENIISFPTQNYDVPYGWIKKRFIETLGLDLDGIHNQHWNAERVIVFHTVILQRVHMVSGAGNIRDHITSRLNLWNKGVYDELVQDSYYAEEAGETLSKFFKPCSAQ